VAETEADSGSAFKFSLNGIWFWFLPKTYLHTQGRERERQEIVAPVAIDRKSEKLAVNGTETDSGRHRNDNRPKGTRRDDKLKSNWEFDFHSQLKYFPFFCAFFFFGLPTRQQMADNNKEEGEKATPILI